MFHKDQNTNRFHWTSRGWYRNRGHSYKQNLIIGIATTCYFQTYTLQGVKVMWHAVLLKKIYVPNKRDFRKTKKKKKYIEETK